MTRLEKLREAALNLGMSERDANFYAELTYEGELMRGEWERRNDLQRECGAPVNA